jgi:hypothetical protein
MRTTFLAIFFALVASCATADEIDDVVTNLPSGWTDNETGVIITPQTASTEDVLRRSLKSGCFIPVRSLRITSGLRISRY